MFGDTFGARGTARRRLDQREDSRALLDHRRLGADRKRLEDIEFPDPRRIEGVPLHRLGHRDHRERILAEHIQRRHVPAPRFLSRGRWEFY